MRKVWPNVLHTKRRGNCAVPREVNNLVGKDFDFHVRTVRLTDSQFKTLLELQF